MGWLCMANCMWTLLTSQLCGKYMQEYQTVDLRDWLLDHKGPIPLSGILVTDPGRYLEINIGGLM